MLLFRQILVKQSQREKFEWVPLRQADGTYHVVSDFYKGFVSLDYLKELDNTYQTGQKLRSKHLNFVSHEMSLDQIKAHIRLSANQLSQQEEESEMSNNLSPLNPNHHKCFNCNTTYTNLTVPESMKGCSAKNWLCKKCIRCTNCHSQMGNQRMMLICQCCNSPFHIECLHPSYKKQIHQYIQLFEVHVLE